MNFAGLQTLLETIHTLRAPGGCPWDRKQTLDTAVHHLHDESAELLEAAIEDDPEHVREELGDLLFMVCFVCEILSERMDTDLDRVAELANEKLVRRHPHVFGEREAADAAESQIRWNEIKAEEKRARGIDPELESAIKDLPASAAPLHQAYRYQKDAAHVGFDWDDSTGVWDKLAEETQELRDAVAGGDPLEMESEVGDLIFAAVNLSRWLGVHPDMALRKSNARFRERFHLVEAAFGDSPGSLREASLAEMEAAWQQAKRLIAARETETD